MMELHGCPRCGGAVVQRDSTSLDGDACVNCGWRGPEIPDDVLDLVQAHLGKTRLTDGESKPRIGSVMSPSRAWGLGLSPEEGSDLGAGTPTGGPSRGLDRRFVVYGR